MTPPTTIKAIVVLVKLSDGAIREVVLSDLIKREIFETIDKKHGFTLGEDMSETIKI